VLAAEHLLRLALGDLLVELVEHAHEVVLHGLALLEPLVEHAQVVGGLGEPPGEFDILFESSPTLQDLLRLGLVLPEIGCGCALLEAVQLVSRACGLKDSL
jgi:hypothetical protein